ncbi:MFS transporter [Chitinimonas taiwanensis]|uniref:MFS transporter n=1 Tax=Chitinimonas taiwanensis TaxID=240412 RepID=UPI0035B394E7
MSFSAVDIAPRAPEAAAALRPDRHTALALAAAALVMGLGQTTLFTFLPLLMAHTGLSLARITAAFAIGSGLFLIGAPLWSRLSDFLGRRSVVAIALGGFALSHVLLLWQMGQGADWQGQGAVLMLGRVIYGLTVSGLVPTCQAWLADLSSAEQRLGVLSRLSASLTLGRLLGPALAACSLWLDPLGPLWLVALAAWPALLLLPFTRQAARQGKAAVRERLGWQGMAAWLTLAGLMQLALGQVQYALGPLLGSRFGLSASAASATLGWLLTACALVVLVLQLWLVPRCRAGRPLLLAGGLALLASGVLLALPGPLSLIWIGFLLLGVAAALLVPTYTTLASLAVGGAGQARVAGVLAAAHTVGFSLAAALAGWLFGLWPAAPFWLAGLAGLAVIVLACLLRLPARSD